ncbi:MAG: hypothetical protein IKS48_00315 [Eubacterium sp.]|nr:hypothetical protein [Eubacterium sp.]
MSEMSVTSINTTSSVKIGTSCLACGSFVESRYPVICEDCKKVINMAKKFFLFKPPKTSYDIFEHKYTSYAEDGTEWISYDGEHWEEKE